MELFHEPLLNVSRYVFICTEVNLKIRSDVLKNLKGDVRSQFLTG